MEEITERQSPPLIRSSNGELTKIPPTPEKVIEAIQKCIPILKELPEDLPLTLRRMSDDGVCIIDRERLNIILSTWRQPPVSDCFFSYYFGDRIDDIHGLIDGMHSFMKDALWHFGDVRRAFAVLARIESVSGYIERHKFDIEQFKARLPWVAVEVIPPEERGFLGYVSGQRPFHQHDVLTITEKILQELDSNGPDYVGLPSAAVQEKLLERVSEGDMNENRDGTQGDKISRACL